MKNAPLHPWLLLLALVAVATPALAQDADPRWTPWLGCWTVSVDTTRGGDPAAADQQAPRARVCVTARANTATLTTTVADKPALTQTLVADGTPQPLDEAGCSGTQRVDWSADGARLFSRAELRCGAGARTVSGITLLAPDGIWIDAQAVEIAGRSSVRVRRFRRDEPGPAAARAVSERLTVEQVIEASSRVAAPALEAALVESRASFALNARRLIQLDDANVPSSVIDLMVALTYPQAFTVRPASRADRLTPFPFGMDPADPDYPWWYGNLYGTGLYFDSPYLYSPFGYSYLGYYPVSFGPAIVILDDGPGGGANGPTSNGRVVNGLGYTRTVPRHADGGSADGGASSGSARGSGGGRGTVSSQGFSRGGSDSSSSGGGSSGSSGTSGGSSGGGGDSGGGGGRTAVDR